MKVLLLPEILGELEELGLPEETLNNFIRCMIIIITVNHCRKIGEDPPDEDDLDEALQAIAR